MFHTINLGNFDNSTNLRNSQNQTNQEVLSIIHNVKMGPNHSSSTI